MGDEILSHRLRRYELVRDGPFLDWTTCQLLRGKSGFSVWTGEVP